MTYLVKSTQVRRIHAMQQRARFGGRILVPRVPKWWQPRQVYPQDLGAFAEAYVAGKLLERGYRVEFGGEADFDLVDEKEIHYPIEIKAASLGQVNDHSIGFQFCLSRDGKSEMRGIVAVLVCVEPPAIYPDLFIVPRRILAGKKRITIYAPLKNYSGMYAEYLNKWQVIDLPKNGNGKHAY